jgi:hypothetical protein
MDAETSLGAWIAHNWRDTPRPPWPRETFRKFYQEQLDYQATALVKSAEAQEIAHLRGEVVQLRAARVADTKRIKDLEFLVGFKDEPHSGVIGDAVGLAMAELRKEMREYVDKKLAAIEDASFKWGDIFQAGKCYRPNTFAVNKGSLWLSLTTTTDPPGSSTSWQLVCKQGAFDSKPRAA